ncbi:hypothetical protein HBI24_205040 [Parastagonospora nodorum]|nr:hypothetical protein HBI95_220790 [Parastagonospora nodorum]KAH4928629.1 hypothetical protein HBH74_105240 [Parastagonospora nodorum]KAH4949359.1 hypothetical protein HBH73_120790 [Parastagonospora nodorum]KAH5008061.1 hypothetical protein HBI74_211460 [Parastagonospora nodorum]KAH5195064.1 hypothetical protein HBH77_145040 [Parastagonospora nodorum]
MRLCMKRCALRYVSPAKGRSGECEDRPGLQRRGLEDKEDCICVTASKRLCLMEVWFLHSARSQSPAGSRAIWNRMEPTQGTASVSQTMVCRHLQLMSILGCIGGPGEARSSEHMPAREPPVHSSGCVVS